MDLTIETIEKLLIEISENSDNLVEFFDKKDKLKEFGQLLSRSHSAMHNALIIAKMKALMLNFGEQETDVYIVSFPKSGTTLIQMIMYQLTTEGDLNFDHIYDVSPWCRFSAMSDIPMVQTSTRRIIKTHDNYDLLKDIKEGKFIFILRDGLDVISSLFHHYRDFANSSVGFDHVVNTTMQDWFKYTEEWLTNKDSLQILYIHYEDLLKDKRQVISKILDFLEIETDEKVINRALTRSSFEFMKLNQDKFGEYPKLRKVYDNFIRVGKYGEGKNNFETHQLEKYKLLSKNYLSSHDLTHHYFKF